MRGEKEMSKYIDLVICEFSGNVSSEVFVAPQFSGLKKGDEVVVEHEQAEYFGTVENCITVSEDEDAFDFILDATGTKTPLKKVLKKITYHDFKYKNE